MNYNRSVIMAELDKAIARAESFHKFIEDCPYDELDKFEMREEAADQRVAGLRKELAELDALDKHIREVVREAPDATK